MEVSVTLAVSDSPTSSSDQTYAQRRVIIHVAFIVAVGPGHGNGQFRQSTDHVPCPMTVENGMPKTANAHEPLRPSDPESVRSEHGTTSNDLQRHLSDCTAIADFTEKLRIGGILTKGD